MTLGLLYACVSDPEGTPVVILADGGSTDGPVGPSVDGSSTNGGDSAVAVIPGVLTVKPTALRIVRGGTASLQIDLVTNDLVEPVRVELSGLPSGVTIAVASDGGVADGGDAGAAAADAGAPIVTFAGGAKRATVLLAASSTATEGTTTFTLRALGVPDAAAPVAVPVPILVAGTPGTPDNSFNSGAGLTNINPPGGNMTSTAVAVAVQADHKIVVGGDVTGAANSGWALVRINEDGSQDTSFGAALTDAGVGATLPTFGDVVDIAVAVDGHIFVLGSTWTMPNGGGVETASVLSLHADGSRDVAFGINGLASWQTSNQYSGGVTPLSLAVDGAGGVYFIAYLNGTTAPNVKSVVAHLSSKGATLSAKDTFGFDVRALAAGANGPFFAGVDNNTATNTVFAASHIIDVSMSTEFTAHLGTSGSPGFFGATVTDGFMDPAGSFAFVGSNAGNNNQLFLGRVLLDGGVVGPGAVTLPDPGGNNNSASLRRGAMQPDSKVVVVGSGDTANFDWTYVARFNPDGSPDNSFATNGSYIDKISKPPNVNQTFNDVAIDPAGRIVAVGWLNTAGWHVLRLWQ
jgi:uncharacterized delta-60 repeat protein